MKRASRRTGRASGTHFSTLDSGLRDETRERLYGWVAGGLFQYPRLGSTR